MATVTTEDPDMHSVKTVDDRGRVYVGKEFVGKDVRVTLEVEEEGDE